VTAADGPDAVTDIQISEDRASMIATFRSPFEVHDDIEVLTRMNLLDDISGETILSAIPQDLLYLLPEELQSRVSSVSIVSPFAMEETKQAKLTSTITKPSNATKNGNERNTATAATMDDSNPSKKRRKTDG